MDDTMDLSFHVGELMRTAATQQENEQVQAQTPQAERPGAVPGFSRAMSVQRQLAELAGNSPRQAAQREAAAQLKARAGEDRPGGLPHQLKSGIEQLSGVSMDGVRVHYNSPQPAQLGAHAYAQGSDIHLAAGQEQHLPHEAWHVMQQAQGRVKPTLQMKNGTPVNDAPDMEREADVMGAKAAALAASERPATLRAVRAGGSMPVQRVKLSKTMRTALRNWVPEEYESSSDEYKKMVAWFEKATQLSGVDVDWIVTKNFDDWYGDEDAGFANAEPASVSFEAFRKIGEPKAASAKPVDPLAQVRKKLVAANLKPADFTDSELNTILVGSGSGWEQAIRSVNEQRLQRLENARLVAERTAKYTAAKALGDAVFPAGLIREVWNLSYAIAVSGNGSGNTTLAQAYSDGDITTAAQAWHGRGNLQPPPTLAPPQPESVTAFHVPGAPVYIEDKSRRAVNPDSTRGRQADFICHWGGVTVNVHVDSTQRH